MCKGREGMGGKERGTLSKTHCFKTNKEKQKKKKKGNCKTRNGQNQIHVVSPAPGDTVF